MFSLTQLVVGIIAVISVFALFTNNKLRRRVVSLWRRKTDEVADVFGDVVTDTKDSIQSAKVHVDDFENKIANLMAKIKVAKNEHGQMVSEAEKWGRIAEVAVSKGDDNGAKVAIGKKQAAEKRAIAISNETTKNSSMCEELRAKLSHRKDEVRDAESDVSVQEARLAGLKMREDMLNASSSFGGATQNLTQARTALNEYEARLDAKDELRGSGTEELERLYMVNTSVDEELARLKSGVTDKDVVVKV